MTDIPYDDFLGTLDLSERPIRSQSVIPATRSNGHRKKYREYLQKLQEKNRTSRASQDDLLKQRENGFQLYVNGAHHPLPRRPSSSSSASSNRTPIPLPFLSGSSSPTKSNHARRAHPSRRQWIPTGTAEIKTKEGAILADLDRPPPIPIRRPQIPPDEHARSTWADPVTESHTNQLQGHRSDTYRLLSSRAVDQSWMPGWVRKTKEPIQSDDDEQTSSDHSLSFDELQQTTAVENIQAPTFRVSTTVGARLAASDLAKTSSTSVNNPPLFLGASRGTSKAIDSLDLENFLQPKEVHIDSGIEEHKSPRPPSATKRSPFSNTKSNDRPPSQADWLERSITQIDLFGRRHRGRLENEKVDDYFTSNTSKADEEHDEEQFSIPELPSGEQLVFNLKSTWGDRHYVGLNGIEIFSSEGHPVTIKKITADPPDINILPEYGNDPRVVTNLIDGVNKTRDDIHMWLAPFTTGRNHFIYITFEHPIKIAMIRIWNYNKSRIYSTRGAKDVDIALNGRLIFKGEVTQACGNIIASNDPSVYGETILFTTDEDILEKISTYDEMYVDQEAVQDDEETNRTGTNRPPTAGTDVRPMTRAMLRRPFTALRSSGASQVPEYYGKKLILTVTETWGDQEYCGLTGLEVVDINDADCPIHSYEAAPRDVTVLPDQSNSTQTLDKLFDGENVTCDDQHLWLCPFNRKDRVRLMITLSVSKKLHGLRIWNYNKSPEDTYRGIKRLHVQLNDKIISPKQGFLLRRAPGHCFFDFAQEIVFAHAKTMVEDQQKRQAVARSHEDDGDVSMPNGFIYEFQLHSTHGDAYYIGLNGLEFYDENGERIGLIEQNIAAYPHSINALNPGTNDDARTPDKLIDGENDDIDGSHSWIAPILPNVINRLFVIFDRPTSVSMIKIWNYAKTANRGVREFSLLVDDLLVWPGILDSVPENKDQQGKRQVTFNTILFSNERILTEHEKQTVVENKPSSEAASGQLSSRDQSVDFSKRPTTSVPRNTKKR